MASIRKRLNRVEVRLDDRERTALLAILDALAPDVGSTRLGAVHAYDDPALEAEYQRYTVPELDAARRADIDEVRAALSAVGDRDRLRLDEDHVLTWVRAVEHLRLVAGDRLGIDADGWEEGADPALLERDEYAMLMALGWVQESLIEAIDPH